MIECVPPDQLAVKADGAVLIANMTGFRAASFSYKETSTNITIRLPEVQVPTVRVYVHPPEQDYIISRGLLTKGGWWYPHNERTRRSIVGTMLQLLAQAPPGASFFDLGGNIGTFSLPLLAAGYSGLIAEASPRNAWRTWPECDFTRYTLGASGAGQFERGHGVYKGRQSNKYGYHVGS